MNKIHLSLIFILTAVLFMRCNKAEDLQSDALNDYFNLEPGKYILYKLDSTITLSFGAGFTVHKYQAKDVIDAPITDNLGRLGWRVLRYLRDSASNSETDWKPNSTYMIMSTRETVEVIENNLRFQKLKLPVTEGFTWKGNAYISLYSNDPNWDYRYLSDWDYTYEQVGSPFVLPGSPTVDSTLTVTHRDETLGTPNNRDLYSERTFSKEVYGKRIGLIYKDFLHWVFQPRTSSFPNGYIEGYGIRLRMIGHN
ncbi:MAG: hypothetical protein WKF97_17955 [Chitinophagaceae bacterium]